MVLVRLYQSAGDDDDLITLSKLQISGVFCGGPTLDGYSREYVYTADVGEESLWSTNNQQVLRDLIVSTPFSSDVSGVSTVTHFSVDSSIGNAVVFETGPRLSHCTAFSTNAVSICHAAGLTSIIRLERFIRHCLTFSSTKVPEPSTIYKVAEKTLFDRMTETLYTEAVDSLSGEEGRRDREEAGSSKVTSVTTVPILTEGKDALVLFNKKMGLALDDWDIEFYTNLFRDILKRNPTSVECFDLAQSNSEHCRHWFFCGKMVIDGETRTQTLFRLVKNTLKSSNQNSVIAFSDNSSAIEGSAVSVLRPANPGESSIFKESPQVTRDLVLTAETHNFPTAVSPFEGAATGTGGRIRDVQATGRGAHVLAASAGYCFGNLYIDDYDLPWEEVTFTYPGNFSRPLAVAIEASNGASDYGNKFGEPVILGFSRSFGLFLPWASDEADNNGSIKDGHLSPDRKRVCRSEEEGERREWIKPIMFTAGIGSIERSDIVKGRPEPGMCVVKVGGPVYRIGLGGGAASSVHVQGDNESELDFNAVQRGDPEMEQKMNRVVRACVEMAERNPIVSIHDQGAGGNGNVLKELCEPAGAVIYCDRFQCGDPTLGPLEVWGAEYQESNALLIRAEDKVRLSNVCDRERCPVSYVGEISGDGKVKLMNFQPETSSVPCPVDLDLDKVLGDVPQKTFYSNTERRVHKPLTISADHDVSSLLDMVLKLPSVGSKRYLTNKVDRSVTGLVAQQQCVGPLHTPVADVAVVAISHLSCVGAATAIGEQPIKLLVDPVKGARMCVGEALTNLVFAPITALKDVKCSANWMWPAKMPGEGAKMYSACEAMSEVMTELGIAVDGGKDSLSMVAAHENSTVKSPGSLVISVYAQCTDITSVLTPDLKCPGGKGHLLAVSVGGPWDKEIRNLGGTAMAQCLGQVGDRVADLRDPALFTRGFHLLQSLIRGGLITAGHDISDGGLVTSALEMAFSGCCGITIQLEGTDTGDVIADLFNEELGFVVEVAERDLSDVRALLEESTVPYSYIGSSNKSDNPEVVIELVNSKESESVAEGRESVCLLRRPMVELREVWEETSHRLELLQTNPECVQQERESRLANIQASYSLTFDPKQSRIDRDMSLTSRPTVAVVREEGCNGDREMVASFHLAGFQVVDLTMEDLRSGSVTSLDQFRGLAFVGGFSYADVLGSAKGWASAMRYNDNLWTMFEKFRKRSDTFSLGICNGCQLLARLGWVGAESHLYGEDTDEPDGDEQTGVVLEKNVSGRFESRFVSVRINQSPALMLRGMTGSVLGVWAAHGEGRMKFSRESGAGSAVSRSLVALSYTDGAGEATEHYPFNPNGSALGVAGLCSPNGRHLALMPHPERSVLQWQWPWKQESRESGPRGLPSADEQRSPWLRMFENAHEWCNEMSQD